MEADDALGSGQIEFPGTSSARLKRYWLWRTRREHQSER